MPLQCKRSSKEGGYTALLCKHVISLQLEKLEGDGFK